jgi:DNA repair protein RadA/Sms
MTIVTATPSKAKKKAFYACTQCGATYPKWAGNCTACNAWNTLVEEMPPQHQNTSSRFIGYAAEKSHIQHITEIKLKDSHRHKTGLLELDRVLGGGLVEGSVVLIGGDPGIGKSTVLLQALCHLSQNQNVLYVTGEESLQQVVLRAKRLGLNAEKLNLLAETQVEKILELTRDAKSNSDINKTINIMVIDSIQTIYTELLQSAPGSVGQVREGAAQLVRYAKQTNTALFLVGHVTKEGTLAGPRVLEHMVDTVLYFEGEQDSQFRVIRAIKNRFGAVNELGVFAMTDKGLKEINNPSAIFLSRHEFSVPGSTVMATWEGTRPLLVEVQALVSQSYGQFARRIAQGLDQNRLIMLLAVLQRHGNINIYDQDVFVNVVGGMKVSETASDLALLLAVISSLKNKAVDNHLMVFGEVGLAGEIRPVQSGQERLREAAKHGFKRAIVPFANAPKNQKFDGLEVVAVRSLREALEAIQS